MTSDAKRALSKTIRSLRERLLLDLRAASESVYCLSVRLRDADLPKARFSRLTNPSASPRNEVSVVSSKGIGLAIS